MRFIKSVKLLRNIDPRGCIDLQKNTLDIFWLKLFYNCDDKNVIELSVNRR